MDAGGVICAATEYAGGTETEAFAVIEERITENLNEVLDRADAGQVPPRAAAIAMATERLAAAAGFRRFH